MTAGSDPEFFPLTNHVGSRKLAVLLVPSLAYSEMAFFSFCPPVFAWVKI